MVTTDYKEFIQKLKPCSFKELMQRKNLYKKQLKQLRMNGVDGADINDLILKIEVIKVCSRYKDFVIHKARILAL